VAYVDASQEEPVPVPAGYRPTGRDALALGRWPAVDQPRLLWHTSVIFLVIGVLLAVPGVIALTRRALAFRADHVGITLGAVPDKLTVRRGPAVCIPWADIEQIILYPTYPRGQGGYARVQCIGIQRRPGSRRCPGQ
jgi:hypothetical protein